MFLWHESRPAVTSSFGKLGLRENECQVTETEFLGRPASSSAPRGGEDTCGATSKRTGIAQSTARLSAKKGTTLLLVLPALLQAQSTQVPE